MEKIVYVIHCVDTEGPLYENLDAKFERLQVILGISGIEKTEENFNKICNGEIKVPGKEELLKKIFSAHLRNYMDTWEKLTRMLENTTSESFRKKTTDSFGGPYIYSWFCLDLVGYDTNPRRRSFGFHTIFDYYSDFLKAQPKIYDKIHWHFHPMSTYKEAHRCGSSLLNSPHITEALARRIIERHWFPSSVRCGFQTERPDIHWFLEQYVPFDFTNTSLEDNSELEEQGDLSDGRYADWRLAPVDWNPYHPSHENYQIPGNCRRLIARALNVLNRFANITPKDIEKAFIQAQKGKPALLAIADHDYRDIAKDVDCFRQMLVEAKAKFPDVKFKFCDAREAMRAVVFGDNVPSNFKLKLTLTKDKLGRPLSLVIDTLEGKVFGPQPFLAVKTRSQRFIHDNLDFSTNLRSWRYVFDTDSILPEDVASVGIGANDQYGNTFVEVIDIQ